MEELSLNLFTIFYLLITPIYIYNIWSFYQLRFGNNNESLLKSTIFCIVSYGLVSGTYLLIEIPTATLIMNVFCGYLISRLFSQNLIQQLAETLVLIVIFISIEILVVTLLNFYTIDYQDASSYQSIIAITLTYLIEYIFIKYLSRRNYQNINRNNHHLLAIVQFVVPSITILLFLFLMNNSSLTQEEFIAIALFFIAINVILFELYDALSKSFNLLSEQQNFRQEQVDYANQLMMMESNAEEWREFRHDLTNRLTPLYGFVEQYPNTDLQEIISNIVPERIKKLIVQSGNITVDSIINTKLQSASANDINLTTEIQIPKQIYIENVDLAVLLGNLLDNAVEGCMTIQNNRFIEIRIEFSSNQLKLNIVNSFDGDLNTKGERLMSRKRNDGLHGFGLVSVQKIVNKYEGIMNIDYTHNTFTTKILIFEPLIE